MKVLNAITLLVISHSLVMGFAQAKGKKKVKVKYLSHTQLDFSGDKIEGRVKAPTVFYIFQRKRSLGHQVAQTPSNLDFHGPEIKKVIKEALSK